MPLVTILAREMRLKFFEVDQRLEMLRVPLVTILALEMRLKLFEVDQRLELVRMVRTNEDGPVVYPANAFDSRLRGD